MNDIMQQLNTLGVIPVVAINDAQDAVKLGKALLDGGLLCAEITFRTAAARDSIRAMAAEFPDMLVGAGTVLSVQQAEQAVEAGAKFIVSPGFDPQVVDWCLQHTIPITPGVLTPTEVGMAVAKGLKVVKFFPAEAGGGIKMLKAISAPYGGVKFIPTGGISAGNLADYLRLPMVHACGGSWMVKKQLIADGEFDTITQLVKEAVAIVQSIRGEA
ncbi:MAG: bifunctional 4-hydroxy-2-oxoglutarate aldolase/2-dehydro-3-deoxy-phosphogluconate aldolase [Anaerolineae bacterium]|nr:bifunctional 4-hydroxy-2-oxoglutarate aldolase/2-dehydro-3-deoxy-phosphogluconate aldolase [Anaerolineae bacterium]